MSASGFPTPGLTFLAQLAKHNETEWFREHKAEYDEHVKRPFVELVESVNESLAKFAPEYRAKLPKGLSRPNRDTRFSKDKSPYRTDISMVFPRDGLEKQLAAGFFLRVRADGADIIGGSVVPGPAELATLRAFIAANDAQFARVVGATALTKVMGELRGEKLQRVPRGYAADHPAGSFLRHNQLYFERAIPRSVVASPKLLGEIVASFKAMTPFVVMLDGALGNR